MCIYFLFNHVTNYKSNKLKASALRMWLGVFCGLPKCMKRKINWLLSGRLHPFIHGTTHHLNTNKKR